MKPVFTSFLYIFSFLANLAQMWGDHSALVMQNNHKKPRSISLASITSCQC